MGGWTGWHGVGWDGVVQVCEILHSRVYVCVASSPDVPVLAMRRCEGLRRLTARRLTASAAVAGGSGWRPRHRGSGWRPAAAAGVSLA